MNRSRLPDPSVPERWLDRRQCAERAHVHWTAWGAMAEASAILRYGKRERANRTFWLETSVSEYLRSHEATSAPTRARRSA